MYATPSKVRQSLYISVYVYGVEAELRGNHIRTCAGETQLESEPEALTAFPEMDKRSDDLYSSYINECILASTGQDVNDSVGKSTKKPYYFVHTVCSTYSRCDQHRARIEHI